MYNARIINNAGVQRTYRHLSRRPILPLPVQDSSRQTRYYAQESPLSLSAGTQSHSSPRCNELGIQHLSKHVHPQIFKHGASRAPQHHVELSKKHLGRNELLGKTEDTSSPVSWDLPSVYGSSLDEHFQRLARDASEPYLKLATRLARASPPVRPRKWAKRSGWTKYLSDGSNHAVDAPNEEALAFDTEVLYHETSFPALACAASPTHWYSWMSPWLLRESDADRHLIPLGDPSKSRLVVGHNIGYDRARVKEEYDLQQSQTFFMDTMSLHVAVNGMCTRQRMTWMKHNKARDLRDRVANSSQGADLHQLLQSSSESDGFDAEEEHLWIGRSSINSLRDVAKFHCGVTIDKSRREWFGELDRDGVVEKYDELLDYCAADVDITHRVYSKVFPAFIDTCPHPVSFAALRHLSSEILPVNESWEKYIEDAEDTYNKALAEVSGRLQTLTDRALEIKDDSAKYENDPWLSQLDWSGQEVKMTKGSKSQKPRPVKRQKMPGKPKWYKDLFSTNDADMNLTVRTRIAPLLFRMAWDGYPLVWSDAHGWTFKVPREEAWAYASKAMTACDMDEEKILALREDTAHAYFKLPHKDGPNARCASPLAKGYLQHFEKGTLASEYPFAKEALEMNASCSYWISSRERIRSQMVVYATDVQGTTPAQRARSSKKRKQDKSLGFILPQLIPMGTITRRAVENTWLTASNAKRNRVGSELKSMIQAPPGYTFVGADVDSQELWIASLMGDAQFKMHGGNALGFMTLEGTKAAGTDLHSRTANILGISRNDAKVFNYGRIYGAGLSFAQTLLKQFNPSLSDAEVKSTAEALYKSTKGQKTTRKLLRPRSFWRGGTESLVFNALEDFAEQDKPRTPVLGAGITEALLRRYISKGEFMTSRVNWAIQSSGVDYLHLLIVSMDYLARRYNISARLAITVHDEIRYLVREEDKYRAAMALQVSNIWTRAMFAEQMGIHDLPQCCAFFSAVDIDKVLRKEVDMDCVTPSHPTPIPPGESLDIHQLLAKGQEAQLDPSIEPTDKPDPMRFEYHEREPVIAALQRETSLEYLKAQLADDAELRESCKEIKDKAEKTNPGKWKKLSMPKKWQPQGVLLPEVPWAEEQRLSALRKGGRAEGSWIGHNQGSGAKSAHGRAIGV
ncbi:MAG: hypothetical protein Q9159_006052 [Coniocarpon cinnabarinum]